MQVNRVKVPMLWRMFPHLIEGSLVIYYKTGSGVLLMTLTKALMLGKENQVIVAGDILNGICNPRGAYPVTPYCQISQSSI